VAPRSITIDRRYRGPTGSGNGGYVAGRLAELCGAAAVEVTLRRPPPLERPLAVARDGGRLLLLDGKDVVAEAAAVEPELEAPPGVTPAVAASASAAYPGFESHLFPECFVCGPARAEGDGLRIFPGPIPGAGGDVAAPWLARDAGAAVVWAAIDCPGAFAIGLEGRGAILLGRMAAELRRAPTDGEGCVVVGRFLGEDGRKLHAATALYGADGDLLAAARQTWIAPRTP
jgi:hypothetical protein